MEKFPTIAKRIEHALTAAKHIGLDLKKSRGRVYVEQTTGARFLIRTSKGVWMPESRRDEGFPHLLEWKIDEILFVACNREEERVEVWRFPAGEYRERHIQNYEALLAAQPSLRRDRENWLPLHEVADRGAYGVGSGIAKGRTPIAVFPFGADTSSPANANRQEQVAGDVPRVISQLTKLVARANNVVPSRVKVHFTIEAN